MFNKFVRCLYKFVINVIEVLFNTLCVGFYIGVQGMICPGRTVHCIFWTKKRFQQNLDKTLIKNLIKNVVRGLPR